MDLWYVRTRGRVTGPFRIDDIRTMRANRQLQGFDEVSQDQMTWEPIDLVLSPQAATAPATALPTTTAYDPGRGDTHRRRPQQKQPFTLGRSGWIVAGGTIAASILAVVVVFLLTRHRGEKPAATDKPAQTVPPSARAETVPNGVIKFGPTVTASDRDTVLAASVGLVVAGATITRSDGTQYDEPESTGTGFAVAPSGYLLTNAHVVDSVAAARRSPARADAEQKLKIKVEPKLWVFFGKGDKYEADLVHRSEDYDMAILKVNRACPWYFPLCDRPAGQIPKLDGVSSVGFPGVDREVVTQKELVEKILRDAGVGPIQSKFPESAFEVSVRGGSVTKRAEQRRMSASQQDSFVLQHTAQIFGGNSGGPLVTNVGLVLGINTWSQRKVVQDKAGKVIADQGNLNNINYALTLPQLRSEIDKHVPSVAWQPLAE
ncbi:S1 family peptidase [Limnoglobus roseus]|uniref:Serine protease n=1 Tax=Limnoglobus roseus TaxID=2598579 RepID=A0A5C1A7V9_9BACT|nr:serine protease [Limnoglobus roseus]QEL14076.1 serine protease [Limnoglobus roseus]